MFWYALNDVGAIPSQFQKKTGQTEKVPKFHVFLPSELESAHPSTCQIVEPDLVDTFDLWPVLFLLWYCLRLLLLGVLKTTEGLTLGFLPEKQLGAGLNPSPVHKRGQNWAISGITGSWKSLTLPARTRGDQSVGRTAINFFVATAPLLTSFWSLYFFTIQRHLSNSLRRDPNPNPMSFRASIHWLPLRGWPPMVMSRCLLHSTSHLISGAFTCSVNLLTRVSFESSPFLEVVDLLNRYEFTRQSGTTRVEPNFTTRKTHKKIYYVEVIIYDRRLS